VRLTRVAALAKGDDAESFSLQSAEQKEKNISYLRSKNIFVF